MDSIWKRPTVVDRDVGLSIDPMARTVRRIMAGGAVEPQSAGAEPFAPDDVARRRERLWNWAMGQDPLRPMSADERRRMALYLLPYLHLRWRRNLRLFLEYTKVIFAMRWYTNASCSPTERCTRGRRMTTRSLPIR